MREPFERWPLLAAAALCFSSGIGALELRQGENTDVAAAVLVTIGAMLAGAWIYASGSGRGGE